MNINININTSININIKIHIIGISIRKGDFKTFFPETQIDDELIMTFINKLIHTTKDINTKIFFCSDDKEYEYQMRLKIKNSIIPNYNNDNDFIDFLILSKCIKIYGTNKSSFSEEASYFGGCDYIPLTLDIINNP